MILKYRLQRILNNPNLIFLKLKYEIKRLILRKKYSSYDKAFESEIRSGFSFTKVKAELYLGAQINLEKPVRFSEKLIHRRLFSRDPIWPVVTCKIAVRSWLEDNGHLESVRLINAETAWTVDSLMSLQIDRPVVVKAAWASGKNLFVSSNRELEKHRSLIEGWFSDAYEIDRLIWSSHEIRRGFLVEDSIADENGSVPYDYKFHCFNGNVEFFQIDIGRFEQHRRIMFDRQGNRLSWCYGKEPFLGEFHIDIGVISRMISVAEEIAKCFSYVRVDLYLYNGDIYFGEITQTQGAGFEQFTEANLDLMYGLKWQYPNQNKLGDRLLDL